MAAVLLDIGKGIPCVLLARDAGLTQTATVAIGLSAILGHAFSPWLRFRGGKGVAITYGVLIGLWHPAWLFPFCAFALLGFLLWDSHPWVMLLTPAETIIFLILTRAGMLPVFFMVSIQALFAFKYASDLDGPPRLRAAVLGKLMPWRQS
jgi:glycerol-3-phosphate acyltransferase PlsY